MCKRRCTLLLPVLSKLCHLIQSLQQAFASQSLSHTFSSLRKAIAIVLLALQARSDPLVYTGCVAMRDCSFHHVTRDESTARFKCFFLMVPISFAGGIHECMDFYLIKSCRCWAAFPLLDVPLTRRLRGPPLGCRMVAVLMEDENREPQLPPQRPREPARERDQYGGVCGTGEYQERFLRDPSEERKAVDAYADPALRFRAVYRLEPVVRGAATCTGRGPVKPATPIAKFPRTPSGRYARAGWDRLPRGRTLVFHTRRLTA